VTRAALAALLALTLAGCATGSDDARVGDAVADRVRAVVLPYLTNVPLQIAAEEGFFADEDLDVEFIRLTRNQEIMTAIASGAVDVAVGMLTVNELNLAASGARVRMVAAMGELSPEHCTFGAFVARRELMESGALDDPEQVRSMKFDIDPLIPLSYWTDELLQPLGLTSDDVQIAYVPPPATVAAMEAGTVDVTMEAEPFLSMLAATGNNVVWEQVGKLTPGFLISVMMYGPDLLDKRPEVGDRFATAVLRAIEQYNEGKTPRNLEIVEGFTGLSRQQVQEACWPLMREGAQIDPTVFDGYQDWNVAKGLSPRVLAPDELFDSGFVERAAARLAR
jgi:NitT/TauT family transport system substrate-binding protein